MEEMATMASSLMANRDNIRNFGTVAHIDHGKTTLSDSLIAAAGLINPELSGEVQMMDYEDQEQQRGITINAANISLAFKSGNETSLINLIDTPGHVDFTGEVIRAMRAVDGVVLVVDAVEGVMPQTETVLRQALREMVKPVLFINKCDRLINELQVTEEEMQKKFAKVITHVNQLIFANAADEFKKDWQVDAAKGSVAFGSAKRKWAVSVPYMKKTNINFKQVYEFLKSDNQKELAKISPVHEVVLDMVKTQLPSPLVAQKYRIARIWGGDMEEPIAKTMTATDENGELAMMITDVSVNPHAGDMATGRVYSGTLKAGMTVKLIGSQKEVKISKVGLFMGNDFVTVNEIPAGNIGAIVGLKEVYAGETVSTQEIKQFESFLSNVEPVITVSVEAKQTKDLPKLISVLKQLTKEDPNLRASINPETGEHLLSGMGELHLEVNVYRIENAHKVPVTTGNPIVVYHETLEGDSDVLECKTPNHHNKFKMKVEKIDGELLEKIHEMHHDGRIRDNKDKHVVQKLTEIGLPKEESRKTWAIHNDCLLIDRSRGIVALFEAKELIIDAFMEAVNQGPMAKEHTFGVKVCIEDATLHEDAIHRGPSQVLPAIGKGVHACMLQAGTILYEPKQTLTITVPENFVGAVTGELSQRRTQIKEMRQEGDSAIIIAKAPVKELIGFSSAMRGATQGRAQWTAEYAGYEPLPKELQKKTVAEIRKRKGMDEDVKPFHYFLE